MRIMGIEVKPCEACRGSGAVLVASPQVLKDLRIAAGLSQSQLGARLGVSGPYISDLEKGNRGGSNPQLVRRWIEVCEAAKEAAA